MVRLISPLYRASFARERSMILSEIMGISSWTNATICRLKTPTAAVNIDRRGREHRHRRWQRFEAAEPAASMQDEKTAADTIPVGASASNERTEPWRPLGARCQVRR